jgi:hypothetical protein
MVSSAPSCKSGKMPSIRHGYLFPNPFQFFIHQSFYHSTPFSLHTDSILKQTTKERKGSNYLGRIRKTAVAYFNKLFIGWYGLDSSGSGQEPVEGSCEHGNEPAGSITFWKILE